MDMEFYGSVTVGERGQIVLPSKLRKEFEIRAGDKILVLGRKLYEKWGIFLVKAEILAEIINDFEKKLRDALKK